MKAFSSVFNSCSFCGEGVNDVSKCGATTTPVDVASKQDPTDVKISKGISLIYFEFSSDTQNEPAAAKILASTGELCIILEEEGCVVCLCVVQRMSFVSSQTCRNGVICSGARKKEFAKT